MNRRDCLRALCCLPIAIPLSEAVSVIDLMDWPNTIPLKSGGSFTVPCGISGIDHRQVAFLLRPGELIDARRLRSVLDEINSEIEQRRDA